MCSHGFDPGSKSQVDETLEVMDPDLSTESPAGEADPASYRDLTKEEVLDRIASGYKSALAGDYRPIHELLEELDEMVD